MESSDYTQKIQELRQKVAYYDIHSIENKPNESIKTFRDFSKLNFKTNFKRIIYICPIIIISILLLLSKPNFITIDNINIDINNSKDSEITKKIIYSDILIYSLLGGFIIDILIWVYLNKKK